MSIPQRNNHFSITMNQYYQEKRKTPTSWAPHDDLLLRHLKETLKLGWKDISSHFPHRTPNACQFRWRRLINGTLRTPQPLLTIIPLNHDQYQYNHFNDKRVPASSLDQQGNNQVHHTQVTLPHLSQRHLPFVNHNSLPLQTNKNYLSQTSIQNNARYLENQHSSTITQPSVIYPFHREHLFPLSPQVNTPPPSANLTRINPLSNSSSSPKKTFNYPPPNAPWSLEEDYLLQSRKDLGAFEISILLPNRTPQQIRSRMSYLNSDPGLLSPPLVSKLPPIIPPTDLAGFKVDRELVLPSNKYLSSSYFCKSHVKRIKLEIPASIKPKRQTKCTKEFKKNKCPRVRLFSNSPLPLSSPSSSQNISSAINLSTPVTTGNKFGISHSISNKQYLDLHTPRCNISPRSMPSSKRNCYFESIHSFGSSY